MGDWAWIRGLLGSRGKSLWARRLLLSVALLCVALPLARTMNVLPDLSLPRPPNVREDLPPDLYPSLAHQFAFEGGQTGTLADAAANINDTNFANHGKFDVPTGAKPSPLFGARPFTEMMLRFEEFGNVPLGPQSAVAAGSAFPLPVNAQSAPDTVALDDFLAQYVTPTQALPSQTDNDSSWGRPSSQVGSSTTTATASTCSSRT